MIEYRDEALERLSRLRLAGRNCLALTWNKITEPETLLGVHRDKIRKSILEAKTILEMMALAAVTVTAGLLTKSEVLKQGGIFIALGAMLYFNLLFPHTVGQASQPYYRAKNVAYWISKAVGMFVFVYFFNEWIGRLTESGLGLVLGELPPVGELE